MTNATSFSIEETAAIGDAKRELEHLINKTGVYAYQYYDRSNRSLVKNIIIDDRINIVIAGGVIPAILNKEYKGNTSIIVSGKTNDIDVFILNLDINLFHLLVQGKNDPWVVKYFFDEENDNRQEDYKNPHVFATATNHVSNVQYILTDHKNRKELLDNFDFLHCTASYYDGKLFINRETYDAIMKKQLIRVNKKKAPKQWRVEKFVHRGWTTEAQAMYDAPSKTLKEILQGKLDILRGTAPTQTINQHGIDITMDDTLEEDMRRLFDTVPVK